MAKRKRKRRYAGWLIVFRVLPDVPALSGPVYTFRQRRDWVLLSTKLFGSRAALREIDRYRAMSEETFFSLPVFERVSRFGRFGVGRVKVTREEYDKVIRDQFEEAIIEAGKIMQ